MLEIVSLKAIVEGLSAPAYTKIEFLPKMIKNPLCAAKAVMMSYPVGQTLVISIEPEEPPAQPEPFSKSDQ